MSEFRQAVKALRDALADDANKQLARFRDVTGISPSVVIVELVEVPARGDVSRHLIVANVRVAFEESRCP